MKINKAYGSKERLVEMMNGVNKGLALNENFDYNDMEKDHLNQPDLDVEMSKNPPTQIPPVAKASEPTVHPEHPDNTGSDLLENNEKEIDPNNDAQVRELYVLLSKDGIEDMRGYYPDWLVDELYDHDYIVEDSMNGTYLWMFTPEGQQRFPNAETLKKFLLSEYNRVKTFKPGESAYLRGNEPSI